MQLTNAFVLLTAALATGAAAHPSVGHRHEHDKRGSQFYKGAHKKITTESVVPTPTVVAAAAVTSSVSSSASLPSSSAASSSSGTYIPFCNGATSKLKRATSQQIGYTGNTGTADHWGCNMQTIPADISHLYDYTTKFNNKDSSSWTCNCFNKIGPTGKIDGFWNTAVSFSVPAGASQWMAFDKNSQGGCACAPGSEVPKTSLGQHAGTWLEFDWGNESNGGNSGADASVLVAGAYNMKYYGMSVAANGKVCSWVKSDGSHQDAYMPGMEAADGVGCKGYLKGSLEVSLGDN